MGYTEEGEVGDGDGTFHKTANPEFDIFWELGDIGGIPPFADRGASSTHTPMGTPLLPPR